VVSLGLALAGCSSSPDVNPKVPPGAKSSGGQHAVIDTDKGAIEITFLERDAPNAVENFRLLAEHGYYDGLTFHRIVRGFMIQGGDPLGTGNGGQSAWGKPFVDEIDRETPLYKGGYKRGMVAMANSGPNTNGSQFFITHIATDWLDGKHTVFGQTRDKASQDVVNSIKQGDTITSITIEEA
jgi:cyclophilin family peptidyl-prolyl cis-trans isomerase